MAEVPDEALVEMSKTQEMLEPLKAGGFRPLSHSLDLVGICPYLPALNDVAQEANRRPGRHAECAPQGF